MIKNKALQLVITAFVLATLMTLTAFAEVVGGFGAIGGVDETYYAAPATLNENGNGLALGSAIQLTAANNKNLAGLYAVSTDSTFAGDYEIVYVYGAYAERLAITERTEYSVSGSNVYGGFLTVTASTVDKDGDGFHDTYGNPLVSDGTNTYVVAVDENEDGVEDNYPRNSVLSDKYTYGETTIGEVTYKVLHKNPIKQVNVKEKTTTFVAGAFSGNGGWYNYFYGTGAHMPYMVMTGGNHINKTARVNYYNALQKYKAETDETAKQAYLSEMQTNLNTIIDETKNYCLSYALTNEEIVKVSEVNYFKYQIERQGAGFVNTNHVVKIDIYVVDDNGKVTVYPYEHAPIDFSSTVTITVDFEGSDAKNDGEWMDKKPTEGYFIGFKVWPYYGFAKEGHGFEGSSNNSAASGAKFYFRANTESGYYSIDTPKIAKPINLSIDENGKICGTVPGVAYEYAVVSAADKLNNKALTYNTLSADTTFGTGLYAVRAASVQGEYTGSDEVYLYVSGTVEDKTNLIERTVWATSGKKTVAADKVVYDDDGNPIDPVYGNPLKLIGSTYNVVAVDKEPDGWDDNYPNAKVGYDSTNDYYYVYNYTELRVAAKNTKDFVDGTVTGSGLSTSFWSGNFRYWAVGVTAGRNISGDALKAFKNAQDAYAAAPSDDTLAAKKAAFDTIANADSVKKFSYAYAIPAEKIPTISELSSYTYELYFYENVKYEGLKVKFEAFVMDDKGQVSTYTFIHNPITATTASENMDKLTVDFGGETHGKWDGNKPTEGYLLGFKVWPFYNFNDYTKFTANATSQTNLVFYPRGKVTIKSAQTTPEITMDTTRNTLTVSNFASGTTYAYSNDEGKSWTEFTTKTIDLPRIANTYYWVKACKDELHYESEIVKTATPTACLLFKGASLVLDGKIGLRLYFDFDAAASGNMTQLKIDLYDGDTHISDEDYLFKTTHSAWKSASFREDGRTAYITFYMPPKDYDNITMKIDYALCFDPAGNRTYVTNTMSKTYTISSYFDAFADLVEAGNAECIAANDFVSALEAYCENADVYFDADAEALETVVTDTNAIDLVASPVKSGKITYNGQTVLEHHSTSLILEEAITIRHYFKYNEVEGASLDALTAAVDKDMTTTLDPVNNVKESGGVKYIYFDVENVHLDNLGEQYTLSLALGEEKIDVKYSVLNYIKLNYNINNDKLTNLVKSIYNCYKNWLEYPFKEARVKTISEQRREISDAMTLAMNTETVWKEVPKFNPTIEKYSHIKAITYDGLNYKGQKTKVFAYIGFPEGASKDQPVPAVVLVHGGNGHPFMEWVRIWNEKGYAAIAMETTGCFPTEVNAGINGSVEDIAKFVYEMTDDFAEEGYTLAPERIYPTEYTEVSEQWAYHGISQIILASNILRQDERVDTDNIGITGISWGGVTTTQVIGYDNRYSFAIPIYGMAYLGDEMRSFTNFNDPYVNALWASEKNLDNATMPILWFAFNDDNNFGVNQYVKSYLHTEGVNAKNSLIMLGDWGHSHVSGWAEQASYYFADWVTYGDEGFITFASQPEGREINCEINIPENVKGEVSATIYYITEPMSYSRHDKFDKGLNYIYLDQFWQTTSEGIEVDEAEGVVRGNAPQDARGYYINLSFKVSESSDEVIQVSSVYVAID